VLVTGVLLALAGCGATSPQTAPTSSPTPTRTPTTAATPTPTSTPTPALGSVPPAWLGTRVLPRTPDGFGVQAPTPPELRVRRFTLPDELPALPGTGFASRISSPAPASVIARSTWAPGCPVTATQLSWVRLTFWGFDHRRHTGELLTNTSAAADLVRVFRSLYVARFPIEQMRITTKADQSAAPTGDGNDTVSFDCRPVVGATVFSQHAYGLAIDVDPFQNPYEKGDLVLPELAGSYTDRSWRRPGMILPGDAVVRAFASIGWSWGGSWNSLKDLQHFSANGR